jgi:CubicO group peptidase (beta-lactamase class C family)
VKPPTAGALLTPVQQKVRQVETHLVPAIRIKGKATGDMRLATRMKKYQVPGVTIAVINNLGIEWVKAYGDADTATLFQAGAAGEPITAILALRLAQARKLDLNRDVNHYLKSWKLPKSEFTKERPVTVRELLAHGAGLTATSPQPFEPTAALPTLVQILNGVAPGHPTPVRSVAVPGEATGYSAADYDVVEQLITDVTQRPFAAIASDSLLAPLAMHHSFFRTSAPVAPFATGHDGAGDAIAGRWRSYPELAAAGLWTTAGDLAQLALVIQRAGAGRGKVLNAANLRQLLTAEHVGWPALGVHLEGRDESLRFRTTGRTEGYASELIGYVTRGQGAVVMTDGARGDALNEEILNAVAVAYSWPDFLPAERTIARADVRLYDRFVGRYAFDSREVSITRRGTRLFLGAGGKEPSEMLPQSVSEFFTSEPAAVYSFVFDDKGKVQAFTEAAGSAYTRWDKKPS